MVTKNKVETSFFKPNNKYQKLVDKLCYEDKMSLIDIIMEAQLFMLEVHDIDKDKN